MRKIIYLNNEIRMYDDDSSCIERMNYFTEYQTLDIRFKRNIEDDSYVNYRFWNVPTRKALEFFEADSLGRYFNSHIKNSHQMTKALFKSTKKAA